MIKADEHKPSESSEKSAIAMTVITPVFIEKTRNGDFRQSDDFQTELAKLEAACDKTPNMPMRDFIEAYKKGAYNDQLPKHIEEHAPAWEPPPPPQTAPTWSLPATP